MRALIKRINNPYLLIALALVFVFHGSLLFFGSYKRTYDALIHIFFADHYARAWFDHWEYRWYTGFSVTSYPPGAQQSIALLSYAVGLQNGFIIVQLCSILLIVLGVYRFSKLWVSEEAAGYAALLAVFASSINETVHVFGQLPTTFSLGFLLNALPYVKRWLQTGSWGVLITAWLLNAATTAGHHVTTIFGAVFFVIPTVVSVVADKFRTPLSYEQPHSLPGWSLHKAFTISRRYLLRVLPVLLRSGLYFIGLGAMLYLVVYPFWQLSKLDPISQVPIPHASRDSFIANPNAGLVFWLVPYGMSLLALPFVWYKGFTTKAWPIACSFCMLFLLGTGGTTPLPRLILRGAFYILTLDRFTFWATIIMLPLSGELVVSLRHGGLARLIGGQFGSITLRIVQSLLILCYLAVTIFVVTLTQYRKFEPEAIDMQPIVTFLGKDQHWRWRYLTLGFGDQMSWLSALTPATSVDGDYNSARRLPELTTTSVERLESAKYSGVSGIGSLQQFLAVPDKYNLKFVFSNDQFYDPLLYFSGWHRLQRLENGIMVWERADIPPLPEVLPRKEIPIYQRIMWGIIPMTAIFSALLAMAAPLWIALLETLMVKLGVTRIVSWSNNLVGSRAKNFKTLALIVRPVQKIGQFLAFVLFYDIARGVDDTYVVPPSRWSFTRLFPWLNRSTFGRIWSYKVVRWGLVVMFVSLPVAGVIYQVIQYKNDPVTIVVNYYDALDFRRFQDAYNVLDPLQRPSYDQYMLELSVQNGLVASYGKLDSVYVSILKREPDRVVVSARSIWLTSLLTYATTDTLVLVNRRGNWYIVPPPPDLTSPPDQFFRRDAVDYHDQGRPIVTTGTTDFANILDRPQLQIISARLVKTNNIYSVVGEVMNTDTNPADITVTAALFDKDSNILSQYNAQTAMIHTLLPKEITPFRVDFEGVAGADLSDTSMTTGKFNPNAFTPISLKAPIHAFEVYAKAVVAGYDLERGVAVENLHVAMVDGQAHIEGQLFNFSTDEITIPHVLVTYYDAANHVVWVDNFFLRDAIRPEYAENLDVIMTPCSTVKSLIDKGGAYTNFLQQHIDLLAAESTWREHIPLPAGLGYAAMRVSVQPFIATQS